MNDFEPTDLQTEDSDAEAATPPSLAPLDAEFALHEPPAPETAAGGRSFWANVREILGTIIPAVVVALLIQMFIAQATRVESFSMEPTLVEKQRLVLDKISYRLRTPRRGEIVVFHSPDGGNIPLIKRVVGLPGETIAIHDGRVYIDGVALEEPYLRDVTHGVFSATTIPEGHIFVMGDNRDHSRDARAFGPVAIDEVIGRALVRYWPIEKIHYFGEVW